jgi:hypothetical protein
MALEVILWLDEAQDFHTLSTEEHDIRKILKKRFTSLAVLERARKNKCSNG